MLPAPSWNFRHRLPRPRDSSRWLSDSTRSAGRSATSPALEPSSSKSARPRSCRNTTLEVDASLVVHVTVAVVVAGVTPTSEITGGCVVGLY